MCVQRNRTSNRKPGLEPGGRNLSKDNREMLLPGLYSMDFFLRVLSSASQDPQPRDSIARSGLDALTSTIDKETATDLARGQPEGDIFFLFFPF